MTLCLENSSMVKTIPTLVFPLMEKYLTLIVSVNLMVRRFRLPYSKKTGHYSLLKCTHKTKPWPTGRLSQFHTRLTYLKLHQRTLWFSLFCTSTFFCQLDSSTSRSQTV